MAELQPTDFASLRVSERSFDGWTSGNRGEAGGEGSGVTAMAPGWVFDSSSKFSDLTSGVRRPSARVAVSIVEFPSLLVFVEDVAVGTPQSASGGTFKSSSSSSICTSMTPFANFDKVL